MDTNKEKTWRCSICGYLHYNDTAPESCPICNADAQDFKETEAVSRPERHDPGRSQFVVIGAGIAGVSAAESIRNFAPHAQIIILSKEEEVPYMRLNLTRLLAGEFDEKNLPLHSESWYEERGIELRLGSVAVRINLYEKSVELEAGSSLHFDKLVVATGAHPWVPSVPGVDLENVHTVRDVDDVRRIVGRLQENARVACIGGGILGLETAGALAKRGADVTILEAFDYLMPMQLNPEGSNVLRAFMKTLGIKVLTNAVADAIIGEDGCAHGVHLKRGKLVPADIVVIAAGDRANAELLRQAGLAVNQGVLVDNFLRTTHPDIYAVGDVAEHDGVRYGAWSPAMYMGKIAGMNAAGVPTEFGGIPRSHLLKVLGKPMLSSGVIKATDGSYRAIEDHADGGYRMFMFRDYHLVGVLLIGKLKLMKAVRKALQARLDMKDLLLKNPDAEQIAEYLTSL